MDDGDESDQNSGEENNGGDSLNGGGDFSSAHADRSEQPQCKQRDECLAEVDVISGNFVIEADLKEVAEQISEDQCESGCIRPSDRDVDENQKPRTEEAVVVAELAFGISVSTAGVGVAIDQVVVVISDDQHDNAADDHSDHRSDRPGDRQKSRAGHDERAPTDRATE